MDGNDLGMIARVFMFLLKGLKYVLKLVWFTGLWWFCVPLVVGIGYEEITGTFIQNNQIMDGIFTILWYACYVLCPLNFLQIMCTQCQGHLVFYFPNIWTLSFMEFQDSYNEFCRIKKFVQ